MTQQAAPHPRMHGLTHVPGGPDPIPGLLPPPSGSFTDWVLALPGVWAYWPLQDASGDAVDLGPLHADMQPVGTPAYHAAGPNSSDLQYAVRLTGAPQTSITDDSFHNVADELELLTRSELTAMCWVRWESAGGSAALPIIGSWDVFRTGWALEIDHATHQLIWNSGNGTSTGYLLGPVVAPDTWTFVAVTSDSGGVKLYVNGSEVASGAATPYVGDGGVLGIRVGAMDLDTGLDAYHFYGNLAGAVFVAYALTGGQILEAYQAFSADADSGAGGAGQVLTLDANGTPTWAAPGVEVTHGDGPPAEAPVTNPPSLSGPTNGSGWHLDNHTETAVLYDSSPARFDVPARTWVRVPFNTVRIQRSWETSLSGPVKSAWLADDRDLTAQARNGLLHVSADMTATQAASGWFSIEYPILDFTSLPDNPAESGTADAYARAARIVNATDGSVIRETPGSGDRQFFEWLFRNFAADGLVGIVQATADNPYPVYTTWSSRALVKPAPYPQINAADSLFYYKRDDFYGGFAHEYPLGVLDADLAAGDNLCLQAWQDTPWTLRFSTDHFPNYTPLPYPELWKKRPYLALTYKYDPDSIDHTTGRLL